MMKANSGGKVFNWVIFQAHSCDRVSRGKHSAGVHLENQLPDQTMNSIKLPLIRISYLFDLSSPHK